MLLISIHDAGTIFAPYIDVVNNSFLSCEFIHSEVFSITCIVQEYNFLKKVESSVANTYVANRNG